MRTPDLLSAVCHDLKDPLASIVMGAGFLRRTLSAEDQTAQRVVDAIHRAAERMSQLITNFSDLARIERRELVLEKRPHDVGAIVTAAFEQLGIDASVQGVPLSLELGERQPTVACDHRRVLQILRHLGSAALSVVPEGGSITVSSTGASGGARVEVVAKRRPGPASRRIIAEPPRPALALAEGLIELHGGKLTVSGDGDSLVLGFLLPDRP
jgi:signal transduction histidine kinase